MTINITEHTRSEQAQRESDERYRTLFESIDEGICIVEMLFDEQGKPFDYRFLETNPTFEKQTGLAQSAGKTARELMLNLEEKWIEIYGKVALTGEAVRFVDGSETMNRWFDVYAVRVGSAESRQVAILFTDITKRTQVEEALRTSEERFRAIVSQAAAGVAQVDLAGKYILVNERYCEIVGYPREELLGLRLQDITHEEDLPGNLELISKLVIEGTSFQVEKRYVRKDETIVWVNNSVAVIRDAGGKPQSIFAITFDITERKQAEDAVRESEARFRNMADIAPVMIWVTEPDATCTYLSQTWYDFTGQTPENGLGFGWVEVVRPEDKENSEKIFRAANENHEAFRLDYRLRRKDGEYRWAIDSAAPRFD